MTSTQAFVKCPNLPASQIPLTQSEERLETGVILTLSPNHIVRFEHLIRSTDGVTEVWLEELSNKSFNLFARCSDPYSVIKMIFGIKSAVRSTMDCFMFSGVAESIDDLVHETNFANKSIRITAHPRMLTSRLTACLPEHVNLQPVNFSHVFSVVHSEAQDLYYYTVHPAEQFHRVNEESSNLDAPCRAYYKALESWDFLTEGRDTKSWAALDVGASPGGWTAVFAKHCRKVVAVDPGALVPEVANLEHVTHLQALSFNVESEIKEMGPYNIIASDMNCCVEVACGIMLGLSKHLVSGGCLLLTLKLKLSGHIKLAEEIQLAFDRLSEAYHAPTVKWLFANSINERTLIAIKK